jgi:hypothetical protein
MIMLDDGRSKVMPIQSLAATLTAKELAVLLAVVDRPVPQPDSDYARTLRAAGTKLRDTLGAAFPSVLPEVEKWAREFRRPADGAALAGTGADNPQNLEKNLRAQSDR